MGNKPAPKRTSLWFLLQSARGAKRYAEAYKQTEVAEAFEDVIQFIESRMPVSITHYTGPGAA